MIKEFNNIPVPKSLIIKLKNLGVELREGEVTKATFNVSHIEFLDEIFSALKIVKRKGFPIPGIIVPWDVVEKGAAGWHPANHNRGTLGVGVKGEYKPIYSGYAVNPSIPGIIFHECGHLYHFTYNKCIFNGYDGYTNKKLISEQNLNQFDVTMKDIELNVSSYALENIREFVAEVFCGVISGNKYPKNIMKVFHNYAYENWNSGYKI
jgi:hypothetical protein